MLALLGNTYNGVHDLDAAAAAIGRSLNLDGGSTWAWGRSGWIDAYSGRARGRNRPIHRRASNSVRTIRWCLASMSD